MIERPPTIMLRLLVVVLYLNVYVRDLTVTWASTSNILWKEDTMNSYRIKYRGYWGNTVGYSVVEAESEEAAKAKVSRWGFVLECLECEQVLEIKESDLANNPPSPPKLQDLDIWTEDEMRSWIKRQYPSYFSNDDDEDENPW